MTDNDSSNVKIRITGRGASDVEFFTYFRETPRTGDFIRVHQTSQYWQAGEQYVVDEVIWSPAPHIAPELRIHLFR